MRQGSRKNAKLKARKTAKIISAKTISHAGIGANKKRTIAETSNNGKITTCGQPYFVSLNIIIKQDNLSQTNNQEITYIR
jgi:hypothetical protein